MDERKQINFTIVPDDSGDSPRTYANFCAISHTPFDFTLSFCEVQPLSQTRHRGGRGGPLGQGAGAREDRAAAAGRAEPDRGPAGAPSRLLGVDGHGLGQRAHPLMAGGDDCAHRSRFVLRRGRARATSRSRRASRCDWRPSWQSAGWSRPCRARRDVPGFAPGTSLAEASVLCPDAVFLDGAFDAYLRGLARRSTRCCDV